MKRQAWTTAALCALALCAPVCGADGKGEDLRLSREDRAVAENKYAYFGVSEYCGLVAVWCAAKEASYYDNAGFEGLRDRWISQIGDKFRKTARGSFGQALVKTGSFSNGEAFFQAAAGANKGEMGLGYSSKEGWI